MGYIAKGSLLKAYLRLSHLSDNPTAQGATQRISALRYFVALDQLAQNSKVGKINKRVLKILFKVVIDDILYEIACLSEYLDYLKENIKRLELICKYAEKAEEAKTDKKKEYYREGMKMLFQIDENFENYKQVFEEYKNALDIRTDRIDKLRNEIKIIKKLEV